MDVKELETEVKILQSQQKYEVEERKKLEVLNKQLQSDLLQQQCEKEAIQNRFEIQNMKLEQDKANMRKQYETAVQQRNQLAQRLQEEG
jgi:hypothetical protein